MSPEYQPIPIPELFRFPTVFVRKIDIPELPAEIPTVYPKLDDEYQKYWPGEELDKTAFGESVREAYGSQSVQEYLEQLRLIQDSMVVPAELMPPAETWGHHSATGMEDLTYKVPNSELFMIFKDTHYIIPASLTGNFRDVQTVIWLARLDHKINPEGFYMPIHDLAIIHYDGILPTNPSVPHTQTSLTQ